MIKYYIIHKKILKNPFLMILTNFIFVILHLKIHPAVHLNTSKAQRHCGQKEKFIESLLAFIILMF